MDKKPVDGRLKSDNFAPELLIWLHLALKDARIDSTVIDEDFFI